MLILRNGNDLWMIYAPVTCRIQDIGLALLHVTIVVNVEILSQHIFKRISRMVSDVRKYYVSK